MTTATGFAEMFIWEDGNPNKEDRSGYTVVLRDDKIIQTEKADWEFKPSDIIGVVGGDNTSVRAISNASEDMWHGTHERDAVNRLLWEDAKLVEWVEQGMRHFYEADRVPDGIAVPDNATYYTEWQGQPYRRLIRTPEYIRMYGNAVLYTPRWERKEWAIVMLIGRAIVREQSAKNPNWKKLKPINETLRNEKFEEWLIK